MFTLSIRFQKSGCSMVGSYRVSLIASSFCIFILGDTTLILLFSAVERVHVQQFFLRSAFTQKPVVRTVSHVKPELSGKSLHNVLLFLHQRHKLADKPRFTPSFIKTVNINGVFGERVRPIKSKFYVFKRI